MGVHRDGVIRSQQLLCFVQKNTFMFTSRQIKVIELRAQGLSFKAIAKKLGITRSGASHIYLTALKKTEKRFAHLLDWWENGKRTVVNNADSNSAPAV